MSKKPRVQRTPANKVPAKQHPEQEENLAATLKAVAHITFSPAAASMLEGAAAGLVAPPYIPKGTVEIDLLIQPNVQRLTVRQKGRSTSAFVFRSTGRHSFWDHKLRAFADLPQANTILQIQPPKNISVTTKDKDKSVIVEMNIVDAELGTTRHELEFSKRRDLQPFSPALFCILHGGPRCHAVSNLPFDHLTKQGCLVSERVFIGRSKRPAVEMHLDGIKVVDVDSREFLPPSNYSPLGHALRSRQEPKQKRKIHTTRVAPKAETGSLKNQEVVSALSPLSSCFPSSRGGTMTATIHQDLLDNLLNNPSSLLNTVATLLSKASVSGGPPITLNTTGEIIIPWLSILGAIPKTAPGSGLFCLLREQRTPSTSPAGPSGGHGLLDRLAVKALHQQKDGQTRLQRQFVDGTLAATMAAWGISSATATSLNFAKGDLWDQNLVTDDQRIEVMEGYEDKELGVAVISGVQTSLDPYTFKLFGKAIFNISVTGINGQINFSTLSGRPFVSSATIGPSGDMSISLTLPEIDVSGLISTSLTTLGWIIVNAPLTICLLMAALCPWIALLTLLIDFVMNNLEAVDATCSGIGLTAHIQWSFNNQTNRVDPSVSVVGTSGLVSVTTASASAIPNIIATLFDSIVAGIGDLFNAWTGLFVQPIGPALQKWLLKKAVLSLPAGEMTLTAMSGSANSTANSMLTLQAELMPVGSQTNSPNVTQVDFETNVSILLSRLHGIMRNAVNPAPTTPATINVGTYVGLAVDQNALNYYLFMRWIKGDFSIEISDATVVQTIVSLAPAGAFNQPIDRIRVTPVLTPRLEIAVENIVNQSNPLLVFCDDIRACFGSAMGPDQRFQSLYELSFDVKTAGTLNLAWPSVFELLLDTGAMAPSEIRAWEFMDPSSFNVMSTISPNDLWLPLVNALLQQLFSRFALPVPPLPQPPNVLSAPWTWPRPLPAMQQEVLPLVLPPPGFAPQDLYMEILALRRVLYLLPALRTLLLGFLDGSGASALDALVSFPAGTTLTTMLCRQGKTLTQITSPTQAWDFLDLIGLNSVFP